jgi:putative transcriptional regulator
MIHRNERPPLFERLKRGLEEGIQFARGELELKTTSHSLPPPRVAAEDIANLRRRLNLSRDDFAGLMNVSPRTVRSWETGRTAPSQSALRLLQVMSREPEVIFGVVGMPTGDAARRPDRTE